MEIPAYFIKYMLRNKQFNKLLPASLNFQKGNVHPSFDDFSGDFYKIRMLCWDHRRTLVDLKVGPRGNGEALGCAHSFSGESEQAHTSLRD